uniref:Putative secreted peptide n=1 Tax=Rhipicephalus pulchellus TaxID=72859 RepID=L7MCJ7_RHIPC
MLSNGAHLAALSATAVGTNGALHESLVSTKPHLLPAQARTMHINHTSVEQVIAGPFQDLPRATGSFHTAIFLCVLWEI